ncbi:retrovirus-related Pol polyprotein from transposon 412 [Carassius gibelio]|uniref:retrovirus-related Pol polyprotein from transposon 412 n=1 Tax=Carassius gibelio TaxID=101364 RepID=UPI00227844CC|nr:retrovirus-related Pol polyprotein from transposon 412 [Carassius gibelio]
MFCIYGFPKRVHSDQGANFESKLIKELLNMAGIKKSHTTPYHPMGNGITERFNRTLGSMIRTLPPKSKSKWPQSLRMLTFCYNCTVHETTGFAPFYLMFGRIPRLPIDVMFQHALKDDHVITHSEFVSHLKRDLSEAAEVAQRHSSAEQARHAKLYDRKVKGSPLIVGDRVLLANRGERGKRKVADKWESIPYEVLSVRSAINVYRVKDTVTGKEKTVHRNLLLPVSFLLRDDEVDLLSVSLSVEAGSDPGDALPHDQLDGDEKTLQWILKTGKNAELDEVVVDLPSSFNAVENIPVDDVGDDSHGCTGRDSDVSQSSFLDDQSAHSQPIQLPTHSPADAHAHVPSSADLESVEPVICTQPKQDMTRIGRTIKPPKRLICEMNDQVMEDSRSSVGSFVTLMRHVFAV